EADLAHCQVRLAELPVFHGSSPFPLLKIPSRNLSPLTFTSAKLNPNRPPLSTERSVTYYHGAN
ncbi:MAG TPA: hypothetical protein PLG59_05790, partial [bacterium]|nr:hypothetical protein [bacterium]